MKITRKSILSGVESTLDLDVTNEQLETHRNGAFAQDVFPHLSRSDREFIISGITPDEWICEFGTGEEEE